MSEINGNQNPRMDRMERALQLSAKGHEHFRQQYRKLLVAQAVQSDLITENARQIAALTKRMDSMAERMDAESIARRETDARLDAGVDQLVSAIGHFIARLPPTSA